MIVAEYPVTKNAIQTLSDFTLRLIFIRPVKILLFDLNFKTQLES